MKKSISIRDEFIKLGQAMKLAGLVDSGVDAKYAIEEGSVKVNGETDLRRYIMVMYLPLRVTK